MIGQVRDWLPYGVVTHDCVRRAIEEAVARWHDRWFIDAYVSVSDMTAAPEAPWSDGDDGGWRVLRAAVAVRLRRQGLARAVDKVLDTGTEGLSLTEGDRYVLAGLERRIVESLVEDIEQAFGLLGDMRAIPEKRRDALAEGGGLLVSLKDVSGRDILTLAVPTAVTLPILRAHLGAPTAPREALRPLTQAMGSANIVVEAVVGRVELTLTELNDLAVGDVLVLDRALDEPIEVAAADTRRIFARAMLTEVDDGVALVFNS